MGNHNKGAGSILYDDRVYGDFENNYIFAVFCDPSKAFDCFSHDKLNYHDITGIAPQPCKFVFKQNSTVSITVKM